MNQTITPFPNGGIAELSLEQASQFKEALDKWQTEVLCFLNNVVNDMPKFLRLEDEICSLNAMLHYHAQIFSDFYSTEDVGCGQCLLAWNITQKLYAAWEQSLKTLNQLKRAATPQSLKKAA
ncbi:MAG TPA: hypothetical protein VN963_08030 [bacterium]|nr:hypothetical protein [bacterium]